MSFIYCIETQIASRFVRNPEASSIFATDYTLGRAVLAYLLVHSSLQERNCSMNRDTHRPRFQLSHLLTLHGKPQPYKKNTAHFARYLHTIVTPVTPSSHRTLALENALEPSTLTSPRAAPKSATTHHSVAPATLRVSVQQPRCEYAVGVAHNVPGHRAAGR